MTKHVHSFERHELNPDSHAPGDATRWGWVDWPDSIRAYVCACGEPGFEIPPDVNEPKDGEDG